MLFNAVVPTMGVMPGLKGFVAAVLGGIGNIPGAMLGGMFSGLAEMLGVALLSSQWRDAIAFAILILVLLYRPSGLLGARVEEKCERLCWTGRTGLSASGSIHIITASSWPSASTSFWP